MAGAYYRIYDDLKNADNVMNNIFRICVYITPTHDMLGLAAKKIESYLGVNF